MFDTDCSEPEDTADRGELIFKMGGMVKRIEELETEVKVWKKRYGKLCIRLAELGEEP